MVAKVLKMAQVVPLTHVKAQVYQLTAAKAVNKVNNFYRIPDASVHMTQ